jgi:hypothetical protein
VQFPTSSGRATGVSEYLVIDLERGVADAQFVTDPSNLLGAERCTV